MENKDSSPSGDTKAIDKKLVLHLIAKFREEIPDEESSRTVLFQHLEENGLLKCPSCPDAKLEKITSRLVKCRRCFRKIWITAGTLFQGVRHIRPYLAALYLKANGAMIGASWFAQLLDISSYSAAEITKKIGLVIVNEMMDDAPTAHSAAYLPIICRRSRETPAREHPRAEVSDLKPTPAMDKETSDDNLNKEQLENIAVTLPEPQRTVFSLITTEPISFDDIYDAAGLAVGELSATLLMLELDRLIVRWPGERFSHKVSSQSTNLPHSPDSNKSTNSAPNTDKTQQDTATIIELAKQLIKEVHRGVSRKCLQIYAALFWCHLDKGRWHFQALLTACFNHPPLRHIDIVSYVSPDWIKLLPKTLNDYAL